MKEPTDAETLRALQFALAPLDRAMRDAGVEKWPPPWSQWDAQAEHEKDLEYESRVDYASWQTDGQEDQ